MQEFWPQTSGLKSGTSDLATKSGELLGNPAVQRTFHHADQSLTDLPNLTTSPQDAQAKVEAQAQQLAKYVRHRNRAVWAQALVLFNVVGIPFSHGVYLEYYYTTALSTSKLNALAVIPALQILCILGTPIIVGWLYYWRGQRSGWRIAFFVTTILAVCVQLPLQWVDSYVLTMILQGPLLGASLGTLFTLSTLVLSSHYQFNLPLVSMQSGFMGFFGAIIYTLVARQGLGTRGAGHYAPAATAGILAGTLLTAYFLIRRVKESDFQPGIHSSQFAIKFPKDIGRIFKEQGTIWFLLGYMLVFFALFIFPIYIVVVLTQQPALVSPDTGAWVLITMFATAALSACISANVCFRERLGPVDNFIASSIIVGAASLLPTWMPSFLSALVCGAVYGIGLGAIIALHIKVTTAFYKEKVVWHQDMPARVAIVMVLGGCSAFAGLLVSAFVIENMENGVRIVTCVATGCLVVGGILIAFARWQRCGKFYVSI